MPELDGIEATRRVLADRPGTAVLVLTSFSDRPRILGAIEAGACGYLLKDVTADEVADGIRAAARGESPVDPRAARTILTRAVRARSRRAALGARVGGPRAARRGAAEQAHRPPAGDQREDGEDAPDEHLPRARRDGPDAGGAVGRAPRLHRAPRALTATEVPLRRRPGGFTLTGHAAQAHDRRPAPRRPAARAARVVAARGGDDEAAVAAAATRSGRRGQLRRRRELRAAHQGEGRHDRAALRGPRRAPRLVAGRHRPGAPRRVARDRQREAAARGPSGSSATSTTSPARTRSWSAPPGRAA